MKYFFLTALLSFNVFGNVSIVSDLDDTIKITNVNSVGESTYNGVFGRNVFTGMPAFFKGTRAYSRNLHVVSAGPEQIKPIVKSFLKKNGIQFDAVDMRNVLRQGKIEFKYGVIRKVLEASSDDVILIGDDVDLDPEIYEMIQLAFPGRVLANYIHIVEDRKIPAGSTRYHTALDLALREYLAGRMSANSVSEVIDQMESEDNLRMIYPKFAKCPKEMSAFDWQIQTVFSAEARDLNEKLIQFCQRN